MVSITDHGGGQDIAERDAPDLEAKLAGLQSPRGWGLFLIRSMVDEMNVRSDDVHHTVELVMHLVGCRDGCRDSRRRCKWPASPLRRPYGAKPRRRDP